MKVGNRHGTVLAMVGCIVAVEAAYSLLFSKSSSGLTGALVAAGWAQLALGILLAILGKQYNDRHRKTFGEEYRALWILIGIICVTGGVNWLLTPMAHPDANAWQSLRAWVDIVIGILLLARFARGSTRGVAT